MNNLRKEEKKNNENNEKRCTGTMQCTDTENVVRTKPQREVKKDLLKAIAV